MTFSQIALVIRSRRHSEQVRSDSIRQLLADRRAVVGRSSA
jgi:hypothetical protein